MNSNFNKSIFINCPFDKEYINFLRPLLFTISALNLKSNIASASMDSSEIRLNKIQQLILHSKFSIHDLSRVKSSKRNEYYRMNMPFELGLDLGCRLFHREEKYRTKRILIIESEPYSYQKALSDLSGVDAKCYHNDAETLVSLIRTWLAEQGFTNLKSGSNIWELYNEFTPEFHKDLKNKKFTEKDIASLPIIEFTRYINEWLINHSILK